MKRALVMCALGLVALAGCMDMIPRDEHPERTPSPVPVMTVLPCGMHGSCMGG